ncbi:MAG: response regulator [Chloroflexi bacterium]|nr:response regulator [Chloroflexota bacterium]
MRLMHQTPPTPHKPFALIVDDDRDLSEAFAMALSLVGFTTEIVNDSTQALKRIAEGKPDIVTLDMQMPRLSGAEVLRLIRADDQIKQVRVILITANERASATEEIERMADVILIKPIMFSQIKEIAARLVHLPDDPDDDDPAAEKTNARRFPINPKPPLDLM